MREIDSVSILSFSEKFHAFVMSQIHTSRPHRSATKQSNELERRVLELDRQIPEAIQKYKENQTQENAINLLALINDTCQILFHLNPSAWEDSNDFSVQYKKLFYNLDAEALKVIGNVYPAQKKQIRHVVFNRTKDNKIEIIRPYPDYETLVYEGGGVRGIAYSGVNEAVVEAGIMSGITTIAGSSAGAITAALVALGYSDVAFKREISSLDFNKFQDVSQPGGKLGKAFGANVGILSEAMIGAAPANEEVHGEAFINSGRALYLKLVDLIQQGIKRIFDRATPEQMKLIRDYGIEKAYNDKKITFSDLANLAIICPEEKIRSLFVTGAEVVRPGGNQTKEGKTVYMPGETQLAVFSHIHSPHMEIAKALRISASIPKFFRSVEYNDRVYIDGGVEQNLPYSIITEESGNPVEKKMATTLGFKFMSPEDIKQAKMFQSYQDVQASLPERAFLPEWMPVIYDRSNFEERRLRGTTSPLVLPVSTEDVNSTDFNLSDEKKDALALRGYENTKAFLESYAVSDRVMVSMNQYANLAEAVQQLELDEAELLLENLQNVPTEQLKFVLNENKPDPGFTNAAKGELIANLQVRIDQLKKKEDTQQNSERQLQKQREKFRQRKDALQKLFNQESPEGLLKVIIDKLKDNAILNKYEINPLMLTGRDIRNILLGTHSIIADIKQTYKADGILKIKQLQDFICEVIAKESGFVNSAAVRDEVFFIEKQDKARLWNDLVEKNAGFSIDLLRKPQVIAYIKSMLNYQELQSWAAANPSTARAKKLQEFFKAVEGGSVGWFEALTRCINGTMYEGDFARLPDGGNEVSKNVARIFFNSKNRRDGEVNMGSLLCGIHVDMVLFMTENLLRQSDPVKFQNDLQKYNNMIGDLSNPMHDIKVSSPRGFRKTFSFTAAPQAFFEDAEAKQKKVIESVKKKLQNLSQQMDGIKDAKASLTKMKNNSSNQSDIIKIEHQINELTKQEKEVSMNMKRLTEELKQTMQSSPATQKKP